MNILKNRRGEGQTTVSTLLAGAIKLKYVESMRGPNTGQVDGHMAEVP